MTAMPQVPFDVSEHYRNVALSVIYRTGQEILHNLRDSSEEAQNAAQIAINELRHALMESKDF